MQDQANQASMSRREIATICVVYSTIPLLVAIGFNAALSWADVAGDVDTAFFGTVAQVIPVVGLAAAVQTFSLARTGYHVPLMVSILAINIVIAEAIALWGVATHLQARWAALAIAVYLVVQVFLLAAVAAVTDEHSSESSD